MKITRIRATYIFQQRMASSFRQPSPVMNTKPSSRKQHETNDPVDLYARDAHTFREPPQGIRMTLRHLGPGLILVGSIVGSGELIMTTKLGAQGGFALLWFVLLSCVIKTVCPSRTGTPCDFQRRDDFGDVQQAAWTKRTAAELALSGVVADCRGQHIPRPGLLVVESGCGYRCGRIGRERAVHLDCGCVVARDAKSATRDGANVRCSIPTDVGVVPVAVPCLPIGHVYQRRRRDGRGRPGTGTGL